MSGRRRSAIITALFALAVAAVPAAAADCKKLVVSKAEFCHAGTSWENLPLVFGIDQKTNTVRREYGQLKLKVWLIFSRIPEEQFEALPWFAGPDDVMKILTDFAESPYKPFGEEIERFYPLGEEVMAASLAARDTRQPYVNIYTYYVLEDDNLVVQTGIEGAQDLSPEHKALHLEAVRAIRDLSK